MGVFAHTDGDYGIAITPSGGVGFGAEAHTAFTFSTVHPRGAAIDAAFSGAGLRGGFRTARENDVRFEVGPSAATGATLSAQASYSFTHDCGNLND